MLLLKTGRQAHLPSQRLRGQSIVSPSVSSRCRNQFTAARHKRCRRGCSTLCALQNQTRKQSSASREDPRGKRFWTSKDMPAQDGKTFIVTGSSSGMGFYCAQAIADHGGHVIVAARSLERCEKAAAMIKESGARGKVEAMHLDLSSFRSITEFAKAFMARKLPLHTLVNNGGVFLVPHDHTQEGFETTVGINYFGTFLLTHLLLDKLKETSPSRIVSMASLFEQLGAVHWDDLEGHKTQESGLFEYANSKIMVIMLGRELNKRLKGTGVESFLSQPGLANTPLNGRKLDKNKLVAKAVDISATIYGQKPEIASYCLQRPATDPTVTGYGGAYFSPPWLSVLAIHVDHAGMREPSKELARDEQAWAQLYHQTMEIVNAKLAEKGLGSIQLA